MGGFLILAFCLLLAGCASAASDIAPQYVSPLQYQSLNCQQIGAEADRVSYRATELAGVQDQKSSNDAMATGVGLILFSPALLMIKGNGETAAELGRMRGEYEALEKVSIQKNCGLQFAHAQPEKQKQVETGSIPKPLQ